MYSDFQSSRSYRLPGGVGLCRVGPAQIQRQGWPKVYRNGWCWIGEYRNDSTLGTDQQKM